MLFSSPLVVGTIAPDFSVPDQDGNRGSLIRALIQPDREMNVRSSLSGRCALGTAAGWPDTASPPHSRSATQGRPGDSPLPWSSPASLS